MCLGHSGYSSRHTEPEAGQFSSLTSSSRRSRDQGSGRRPGGHQGDTCNSKVSTAWSAASFDWHAGPRHTPGGDTAANQRLQGTRDPPDGAPADENTRSRKQIISAASKPPGPEVETEADDGLDNLRRLLAAGKIAGLHEAPPTFTPPSPPGKPARPSNKKQRAPVSPGNGKLNSSGNKRKQQQDSNKRAAPPPPAAAKAAVPAEEELQLNAPPPTCGVQFLGGRRVHSVENIAESGDQVDRHPGSGTQDQLKRSTSMHGHNKPGE